MGQVGVMLPFDGLPLHQHRDAVVRLADAGIGEVSTGESNGLDALTPLVLASAWRPELILSALVVSAFTRGPSIMASTAASWVMLRLRGALGGSRRSTRRRRCSAVAARSDQVSRLAPPASWCSSVTSTGWPHRSVNTVASASPS